MLTKYLFKYLFIVSLAGLGLFLSLSSPAKAEAPIGNWRLDETSGSSFEDSAGPDNDGTCTNCPTPTAVGKVNGTQKFDGTNDTITVPPNSAYDWGNAQSFSVELWLKGTAGQTCASGDEVVVGRVDDSAAFLWSLGCTDGSGLAQFRLKGLTLQSTSPITDGQWHHLAGIRDAANGVSRLYVDGTEVASSTTGISGDFSTAQPVTIGALNGGAYFEGLVDEVTLHNVALTGFEVNSHYYLALGNTMAQMCASPVTMMPLGDSITEGHSSGVDDDDYKISYRKDLWERLVANGHRVTFTGTLTQGIAYASEGFSYHHEGHRGWTDSQVARSVYKWLNRNPSNIVLLHIGTNNIDTDPSDVEDILNKIDQFEADYNIDVTVVLALIINKVPNKSTFSAFNANIKAMAEARIANDGDKIIIVDMENDAGLIYKNKDDGGDFWDSLHPWETGYTKMANLWYAALETFVPACDNVAPRIISVPSGTDIFSGIPFTYTVVADGHPNPTLSLDTAPAGLNFNPTTGLMNYTGSTSGTFPVSVRASNGESPDAIQSFDINVTEPTVQECSALDTLAYWPLDETGVPGNNLFADVYGSNVGTCSDDVCPLATPGRLDGGQAFDGIDDRIEVADNSSFAWDVFDSFSVELWVNTAPGYSCSGNKVFVGKRGSGNASWWLGCTGNGEASFSLRDNQKETHAIESSTPINDGEWHHLVAVRDGAANQNRLYVDGSLEQQVITSNYISSSNFTNDGSLTMAIYGGSYNFSGTLDEVAVYGQALSPAEIEEHHIFGDISEYCSAPDNSGDPGSKKIYLPFVIR